MKKKTIVFAIMLTFSLIMGYLFSFWCNVFLKEKESKQVLNKTYELIKLAENTEKSTNTSEEHNSKDKILLENNVLGILVIPKLNVEAPIKDGTTQDIMRNFIGHFIESDYWNGNVSLASHNGGTSAHYFENLKKLQIDDEIVYITKFGKRKYKVKKVFNISSYDWQEVISNNKSESENTITLITCINGLPNYRLCVKGVEI